MDEFIPPNPRPCRWKLNILELIGKIFSEKNQLLFLAPSTTYGGEKIVGDFP